MPCRSIVAVGAQDAAAIGVVQQRKIADELVLVGRDAFAENAQIRVAVAGRHVAENLVVSSVFLDDINDVLEDAGFADAFGHGLRPVGWRAAAISPAPTADNANSPARFG